MEPKTDELIASFPDLSEEAAKLIFIRQSAQEAVAKGEIKEVTDKILKEINALSTCSNMSKDDIGNHIANLELARTYLAAFTQGIMSGHEDDVMPKIKERNRKRDAAKKVKTKDKKVNDLIAMAMNASMEDFSGKKKQSKAAKESCPKCKKEVFSIKFHKC